MNTAVILKDEFIIRKQADEVLKKFAYLDAGEGSSDEFLKWQAKMKANDLKLEQDRIEFKKIQSKLAYEEAIIARNNLIDVKKKRVAEFQKEVQKLEIELVEKRRIESFKKNIIVKEIQANETKVKAMKLKAENDKKEIVANMIKESEELERSALAQVKNLFLLNFHYCCGLLTRVADPNFGRDTALK